MKLVILGSGSCCIKSWLTSSSSGAAGLQTSKEVATTVFCLPVHFHRRKCQLEDNNWNNQTQIFLWTPADQLSIQNQGIYFFISLMNKEKHIGLNTLPGDTLPSHTANPTETHTIGMFPLWMQSSRFPYRTWTFPFVRLSVTRREGQGSLLFPKI